jgi:RNA polymerase sigma factor (sigma-70 family)
LCQDWHRADDLLQTTAAKLYAVWPRASRLENLDGYVKKILINSFLAEQRSPWWKRVVTHGESADAPVTPPDLDAALDVRSALLTLTAKQRTILVLRYYEDLSVAETADVLHCSAGNVKKQTSVALAAMRRRLGAADPVGQASSAGSAEPARGSSSRRTAHAGLGRMIAARERTEGAES